jgi:hypothetical protein
VNLKGQVLLAQSGTFGRPVTLPRAGLPKGQYVLTVQSGAQKVVAKVR